MKTPRQQPGVTAAQYSEQISAVRRSRLGKFIDLKFDGVIAEMIMHHRLQPAGSRASFISQILSRHRGMGEGSARRFESELGLPPGWLDGLEDPEFDELERLSTLRIERFREHIKNQYGGLLSVMVEQFGTKPTRIDHLYEILDGERGLSHRSAMKIEADFSLPAGYLSDDVK